MTIEYTTIQNSCLACLCCRHVLAGQETTYNHGLVSYALRGTVTEPSHIACLKSRDDVQASRGPSFLLDIALYDTHHRGSEHHGQNVSNVGLGSFAIRHYCNDFGCGA